MYIISNNRHPRKW